MAITLSIELNDAEQAKVVEIAALINPNMTSLQLKTWAETKAKEKLREEIMRIFSEWEREQHNTTLNSGIIDIATAWPISGEA